MLERGLEEMLRTLLSIQRVECDETVFQDGLVLRQAPLSHLDPTSPRDSFA